MLDESGNRENPLRSNRLPLQKALNQKRILVTGGAGFVGSHVVDLLVESGCREIVVVDNMTTGRAENLISSIRSGNVRLVVDDIRNTLLMKELCNGIDIVFHQAGLGESHCALEPRLALEVMVDAVLTLLEQCARSGVRKIVVASSASIYGYPEICPITENSSSHFNRTLQGSMKYICEVLLRSFHSMYGTNYVALRYFDVYGPRMGHQESHAKLILRWSERILAGLPPIIEGNGTETIDMLHVQDVARANVLAALAPITDVALNIGSGTETSLLTLARTLTSIMHRPDLEPTFWEGIGDNRITRRIADTELARQTIGFESRIRLNDGLKGFVRWWHDQPNCGHNHARLDQLPANGGFEAGV
jgi:UDP-glucose 4-epimerase